ncbi:Prostate stem cell antigen [Liparis tanakae]|uniref:Prostate stem cell antigen n=1 Tax=Liparis tanakae TaxID=230148 RepID=A0A4Z2IQQ6_9TELE|nr:Prostate stem cell antigen [Liparis tanakae]
MLLVVLLLSLVTPGLSLTCYVCSSSATNAECNNNNTTQVCQAPQDICMTIVDTLGNAKVISKLCSSEATCLGASSSSTIDASGNGNSVNCCNFNLCNFSGAESLHTHTALLLLTGAVLLLLSR